MCAGGTAPGWGGDYYSDYYTELTTPAWGAAGGKPHIAADYCDQYDRLKSAKGPPPQPKDDRCVSKYVHVLYTATHCFHVACENNPAVRLQSM